MLKLTLKELIELASKSSEVVFGKTGELLPMYHCFTADGKQLILPSPSGDKDVGAAMIRVEFAFRKVTQYVFMSEAWILNGPDDEAVRTAASKGLANHPDRREIIMFSAEDILGNSQTARRYILRPEHGKPKLSPLKIDDMTGVKSEGRLVGLLRTKDAH